MQINQRSFCDFLDKKVREGRRHLRIVRDVLRKGGMKVDDFTEDRESGSPYIYVHNPQTDSSFGGVRLYEIGDQVTFRIQRESKTHPYGQAYALDVPDIFADLVADMKEEEAGKKVMEAMVKTMGRFFILSGRAEQESQSMTIHHRDDPFDHMVVQSSVTSPSGMMGSNY